MLQLIGAIPVALAELISDTCLKVGAECILDGCHALSEVVLEQVQLSCEQMGLHEVSILLDAALQQLTGHIHLTCTHTHTHTIRWTNEDKSLWNEMIYTVNHLNI